MATPQFQTPAYPNAPANQFQSPAAPSSTAVTNKVAPTLHTPPPVVKPPNLVAPPMQSKVQQPPPVVAKPSSFDFSHMNVPSIENPLTVPKAEAQSMPPPSTNVIPEGPAMPGYQLKGSTINNWMNNGARPEQVFAAAKGIDSNFAQGVERMSADAQKQGLPYGTDPVFIARALKAAYNIGDTPKPNNDMAALLAALKNSNVPVTPPTPPTPQPPSFFQKIGNGLAGPVNYATGIAKGIVNDLQSGAQDIAQQAGHVNSPTEGRVQNYAENLLPTMGAMGATAANVISEPLKPIFEPLINAAAGSQGGQQAIQSLQKGITWLQNMHPELARQLTGVIKTASFPLAAAGTASAINGGVNTVENLGESTLNAAKTVGNEVKGGIFNPPNSEQFTESVQAEPTAKDLKDIRAKTPQNIQEPTLLKSGKILPDTYDKELGKVAESIDGYKPSAGPVAKAKVVGSSISNDYNDLIGSIPKGAIPRKEILSAIDDAKSQAMRGFAKDVAADNAWEGAKNVWEDVSNQYDGTLPEQLKARAEFYRNAEEQMGKGIWDKGTPQAVAVRKMGQVINQTIADNVPEGGPDVMKTLDTITKKYDIMSNLATQGGKSVLRSGIHKFITNKWVERAALVVGAGEAVKHGVKFLP